MWPDPYPDAGGEVADPVDASAELAVGASHAGVDHVRVHPAAVGRRDESAVEREGALIDAVESPRDLIGAKDTKGAEDAKDAGEHAAPAHGFSRTSATRA